MVGGIGGRGGIGGIGGRGNGGDSFLLRVCVVPLVLDVLGPGEFWKDLVPLRVFFLSHGTNNQIVLYLLSSLSLRFLSYLRSRRVMSFG